MLHRTFTVDMATIEGLGKFHVEVLFLNADAFVAGFIGRVTFQF